MNARPAADPKDIPNFGWLEDWVARGAEPTPPGFRWLKEKNFGSVVNLRAEDDTEEILDNALGLGHVYFPVVDNEAPTDAQALAWLQLCTDETKRPIYLHCCSGHGRTSTFAILLRMAQGWKLEDAIEEQRANYGFKPEHDVRQIAFLEDVKHRVKSGDLVLPVPR